MYPVCSSIFGWSKVICTWKIVEQYSLSEAFVLVTHQGTEQIWFHFEVPWTGMDMRRTLKLCSCERSPCGGERRYKENYKKGVYFKKATLFKSDPLFYHKVACNMYLGGAINFKLPKKYCKAQTRFTCWKDYQFSCTWRSFERQNIQEFPVKSICSTTRIETRKITSTT